MKTLLEYYQNLPMHISPTAFAAGPFSVGWYSLMYLMAFGVIYFLLMLRLKKDLSEADLVEFQFQATDVKGGLLSLEKFRDNLIDLLLASFMGALIGGRLGYVFLSGKYSPT